MRFTIAICTASVAAGPDKYSYAGSIATDSSAGDGPSSIDTVSTIDQPPRVYVPQVPLKPILKPKKIIYEEFVLAPSTTVVKETVFSPPIAPPAPVIASSDGMVFEITAYGLARRMGVLGEFVLDTKSSLSVMRIGKNVMYKNVDMLSPTVPTVIGDATMKGNFDIGINPTGTPVYLTQSAELIGQGVLGMGPTGSIYKSFTLIPKDTTKTIVSTAAKSALAAKCKSNRFHAMARDQSVKDKYVVSGARVKIDLAPSVEVRMIIDTASEAIELPKSMYGTFVDELKHKGLRFINTDFGYLRIPQMCRDIATHMPRLSYYGTRKQAPVRLGNMDYLATDADDSGSCLILVKQAANDDTISVGTLYTSNVIIHFDQGKVHMCNPK